jgi:hypothetical protein
VVNTPSDVAELSTLRTQIADVLERVVVVAERYDDSSDSAIATDLFAAERALFAARRSLERALEMLNDQTSSA